MSSSVFDDPGLLAWLLRPWRVVARMGADRDLNRATAWALEDAAESSIAQAQGVLVERYGLSFEAALTVLDRRARGAGIPLVEAARWLLTAGVLP
jgi:AmiR/NasT family two-component response regulator